MENHVQITVDGLEVTIPASYTLMQAIETTGTRTPVICYHEATTSEGICRQCVVEIKGWRVLAPACVTRVSDGMEVFTKSERVTRTRRTILEMLNASVDLTEAPEILNQIEEYNVDTNRFPNAQNRSQEVIDDNPFFVRDYQKCLMCWRCSQACGDDIQYTYAITVGGRGFESNITTFFENSLPESTCVFCGNCIAVCPTNALKGKTDYFLERGLDYDQIRLEKRKARKKGPKTE